MNKEALHYFKFLLEERKHITELDLLEWIRSPHPEVADLVSELYEDIALYNRYLSMISIELEK